MHKFVTPETFVHKVTTDNFIRKKQSPETKTYKKN